MHKGRLEAFSDGVIAVIITILVLELKVPLGADWSALVPLLPVFGSYVLSFLYLGTYWNNHHHMMQATSQVNGAVLWANLHLLFWLSLLPFFTAWMGENRFAQIPVALYGFDLLMAAIAYYILAHTLAKLHGPDSALAKALGSDIKGRASVVAYLVGIPITFLNSWVAFGIFVLAAIMWLVPDRRIERVLGRG